MKKFLLYILIIITLIGLFSPTIKIRAVEFEYQLGVCKDPTGEEEPYKDITKRECLFRKPKWQWSSYYYTLAPLPCKEGAPGCQNKELVLFDPTGEGGGNLGSYLNLIIGLFIGISAVLAVIMIVMGGIEYMTTELVSGKEAGRERIKNAIFGLILALGAWTILNQINPNILKTDLDSLGEVDVVIDLVELAGGIYSSTGGAGAQGGGSCEPITDTDNACSVTQLKASPCFSDKADAASAICNLESRGGQTDVKSGSDLLNNGNGPSYSVGLWQINLTYHKVGGLDCPSAFSGKCGIGTATRNKKRPFVGGPGIGNCSVTIKPEKMQLYNDCVAAAQDPVKNTAAACQASKENGGGFKPWSYSANKCGVSL